MRALAGAFPAHERILAAPVGLAPLARLSGAIDRVVDTAPLRPLDPELGRPEVAVDLHGRGPGSHRVLLAARPARLIAFFNDEIPESAGFPAWNQEEHEVIRWCRMLSGHRITADPYRLDLPAVSLPGFSPPAGATVIHPGAAYPARRWPAERWAAVARSELRAGHKVVVTGGPNEVALAQEVARRGGVEQGDVLAGRTGLMELAATVSAAARVLSGDTGVAHLATALRRPSVVLFGPTPPALWGPPPDRPWHITIWKGRRGDPNGGSPDPGLLEISVDEVLDALQRLPSGAELSEAATPAAGQRRAPVPPPHWQHGYRPAPHSS